MDASMIEHRGLQMEVTMIEVYRMEVSMIEVYRWRPA